MKHILRDQKTGRFISAKIPTSDRDDTKKCESERVKLVRIKGLETLPFMAYPEPQLLFEAANKAFELIIMGKVKEGIEVFRETVFQEITPESFDNVEEIEVSENFNHVLKLAEAFISNNFTS